MTQDIAGLCERLRHPDWCRVDANLVAAVIERLQAELDEAEQEIDRYQKQRGIGINLRYLTGQLYVYGDEEAADACREILRERTASQDRVAKLEEENTELKQRLDNLLNDAEDNRWR